MNDKENIEPQLPEISYCRECGGAFYPNRSDTIFCGIPCKTTRHNRRISGGLKLYDVAIKWRENPESVFFLTQIIDQLVADEDAIRARANERITAYRQKTYEKSNEKYPLPMEKTC